MDHQYYDGGMTRVSPAKPQGASVAAGYVEVVDVSVAGVCDCLPHGSYGFAGLQQPLMGHEKGLL